MTATVIVFFHAIITVGNKPLFPQAEKYPTTISRKPKPRQLTSEKILKQHRNATAITYHTTPPFANGQSKEKKRKRDRKAKERTKEK